MIMTSASPKFSQQVLAEFGVFPLKGILRLGLVSAVAAAFGLLFWQQDMRGLGYSFAVATAIGWFGVLYATASTMLDVRPSILGLAKFLLTLAAMAVPIGLAVFLTIVGIKNSVPAASLSGGLLLLGGMALAALLPAWPITQAISQNWVSPMAALRATKGHRGGLIFLALLLGAFNRLIPSVDTTTSFTAACIMAVVGAIGSVAWAMAFVSVSVASSKLMTRNLAANQHGRSQTHVN